MSVQILVSGLPTRSGVENVKALYRSIPYQLYFGGWENEYYRGFEDSSVYTNFAEPSITYHCGHEFKRIPVPKNYQRFIDNGMAKQDFWKYRTRQILIHGMMLEKYNQADITIRARYDTIVSNKLDGVLQQYVEECRNTGTTFGFFVPKGQNTKFLDSVTILPEDHPRQYQHQADHLIIHRTEKFDVNYMWGLHDCQELIGGEWGWYQILQDPHQSILGVAGVNKES